MSIATAVRNMTRQDLPAVLAIERSSFPRQPWPEEAFRGYLRATGAVCLVCARAGEILGYCVLELLDGEAHLVNLAIREEERRQGLGRLLLTRAGEAAREKGAHRIFLEVDERNLPAQLFYRRIGYRATEVLRGHSEETGDDAYRMALELETADSVG